MEVVVGKTLMGIEAILGRWGYHRFETVMTFLGCEVRQRSN